MFDSNRIIAVLSVMLIVSMALLGQMYKKFGVPKNAYKTANQETANAVYAVGELMVLPSDEEPNIATVTDPDKLKGQAFFANAKAGDKVLIYQNRKIAILFSPLLNKIIEVAQINFNGATSSQATTTVSVSSKKKK